MATLPSPHTLVLDTSGVLALYDASDKAHAGALECIRNAALRLIPAAILAEIDYMLGTRLAPQAARDFLTALAAGFFLVEPFTREDAVYCGALLDRYQNLKLGLADAAVMAVAERCPIADVLSLDNRHFGVVKPAAFEAFRLWPQPASVRSTKKKRPA